MNPINEVLISPMKLIHLIRMVMDTSFIINIFKFKIFAQNSGQISCFLFKKKGKNL